LQLEKVDLPVVFTR